MNLAFFCPTFLRFCMFISIFSYEINTFKAIKIIILTLTLSEICEYDFVHTWDITPFSWIINFKLSQEECNFVLYFLGLSFVRLSRSKN